MEKESFFSKVGKFFRNIWNGFVNKVFPHIKKFFLIIGKGIKRFFKNQTVSYSCKRILSSCLTITLLVLVVICLIRLLPETSFYNVSQYNKIKGQIGGDLGIIAANRYKFQQLFKYGLTDQAGNYRSVFYTFGDFIYKILPIPKQIPVAWTTDYSEVIEYETYLCYFGHSLKYAEPVTDILVRRMPLSFTISIVTTILTYLLSVPLGIAMAKKPGGIADKIGNVFIVLNYAIPALVFYLIMNSILGDPKGVFGWAKFGFIYEGKWHQLIPPIACVVFLSIPGLVIWIRRFMVDELSSDYVKFARSKGLSEGKIMYTHVLRNAMVPLVRNLPGTFLGAIVGSYYIETIWNIPGTGILLTTALKAADLDIPVIQGLTVIYAAISMLSFLLGDLITVLFDPRIKITSKE